MESSRAQLGEPRCAVKLAAPHRLLAGRVQQHRRGLRGGMTARPIFSAYRLHGVTPRVADGTFAAGSRAAEKRSNRLRGGTAGIFLRRWQSRVLVWSGARLHRKHSRDNGSHPAIGILTPARLAAPGPEQVGRGHRSSEPPSGGLPPSQHLGYPDGGGLTSMCESRQLPTPRAPVRTLPPIFSLLRCCETAPTGRGARIFLP